MRFENQVAVITGASEGIGRATAESMAREGAAVAVVARNAAKLEELVAGIVAGGGRAIACPGDATDPALAVVVAAEALGRFGTIDVLVNCVGGSTVVANPSAPLEETDPADWRRVIGFNMDPTFYFCRAVIPAMKKQRAGRIVNLSSVAAHGRTGMTNASYSAAKGGIIAFTKKLAIELAPWGINVNATAPGLTLSERLAEKWNAMDREKQHAVQARIPLGRPSTPQEQADVICFLASSAAAYVTGVTIDVTGGA